MASFDAAPKANCSAAAVMTCYTFNAAQSSARRMQQESTEVQQEEAVGTKRRASQLTVVSCIADAHGDSYFHVLVHVYISLNGMQRHAVSKEFMHSYKFYHLAFACREAYICEYHMHTHTVCVHISNAYILTRVSSKVEQGFLAEHNAYRTEVNRPALTWDSELAQVSIVCMPCVYMYVYVGV
jgi:uncharacterized protein YkwD